MFKMTFIVRNKTVKTRHMRNLCDLGFGKDLLDMTPKAQSIKKKRIKQTSAKLKTLALQKTPLRK